MTRIIKKRKKTSIAIILGISFKIFCVTGVLFIVSCSLLRSYNVSLLAKNHRLEKQIDLKSDEKESLFLEVSELKFLSIFTISDYTLNSLLTCSK